MLTILQANLLIIFGSGEKIPNSDTGAIHLEKQHKKNIWEEYVGDCEYHEDPHLSYNSFLKIWRECFPHVKIRSYKQVSGTAHHRYNIYNFN